MAWLLLCFVICGVSPLASNVLCLWISIALELVESEWATDTELRPWATLWQGCWWGWHPELAGEDLHFRVPSIVLGRSLLSPTLGLLPGHRDTVKEAEALAQDRGYVPS